MRNAMLAAIPAAALAGWLLHGSPAAPSSGGQAPPPVHTDEARLLQAAPDIEPLRFPDMRSTDASSLRNVFAFVEPPPAAPVQVVRREPVPIQPVIAVAPSIPIPPSRPEPEFGYRCIGTFGPEWRRFAVFAGPGEIVNAEIGHAIGQTAFVLREIGVETITVELPSANVVRRLEIGR